MLYRIWCVLAALYAESALRRFFNALHDGWGRLWAESRVARFCARDGKLTAAWRGSVACAVFTVVLGAVPMLLGALYRRFRELFDGSAAVRLGFACGASVPRALGWLLLAMLVTPYEIWNNLYSLAALLVFLVLLYVGAIRRRSLRPDVASLGPWAVCFACLVVFSYLVSSHTDLSYRFLFFHLTGMLCVLLVVSAVRSEGEYVRLAGFAALGVFAASVYGVVQRLQGIEVNPSYVDLTVNEGMPGRVFSVFENPNTFAEVLVMLLPVTAGLFFAARTRLGKAAAAVSFLAGTVSLAMTYSRASWIGFVVAAAVFVFLMNRRLVPWFVLLGLFALPLLPQTIVNRLLTIFNSSDSSTASRIPIYEAALRLIRNHTLFGVGLGTDTVRQVMTDELYYYGTAPFVHCHDIYLQIWAEMGLVGLLAFLGSMASAVKNGAKAALSPETPFPLRALSAGCASGVVGVLVCCLADYVWMYPRVMVLFWFLFALALSGVKLARAAACDRPAQI